MKVGQSHARADPIGFDRLPARDNSIVGLRDPIVRSNLAEVEVANVLDMFACLHQPGWHGSDCSCLQESAACLHGGLMHYLINLFNLFIIFSVDLQMPYLVGALSCHVPPLQRSRLCPLPF